MTVKEIEGRCWFPCIDLLLLSRNIASGKLNAAGFAARSRIETVRYTYFAKAHLARPQQTLWLDSFLTFHEFFCLE